MSPDNDQGNDVNDNPYASPKEVVSDPAQTGSRQENLAFRRAVIFALIQQIIVMLVMSQVLDGGDAFLLSVVAALLSGVPIAVIAFWRSRGAHRDVSTRDTLIMKYSFWVFFVGMCFLYSFNLLPAHCYSRNRRARPRPPAMSEERRNDRVTCGASFPAWTPGPNGRRS
jgi:hypothetical protein